MKNRRSFIIGFVNIFQTIISIKADINVFCVFQSWATAIGSCSEKSERRTLEFFDEFYDPSRLSLCFNDV